MRKGRGGRAVGAAKTIWLPFAHCLFFHEAPLRPHTRTDTHTRIETSPSSLHALFQTGGFAFGPPIRWQQKSWRIGEAFSLLALPPARRQHFLFSSTPHALPPHSLHIRTHRGKAGRRGATSAVVRPGGNQPARPPHLATTPCRRRSSSSSSSGSRSSRRRGLCLPPSLVEERFLVRFFGRLFCDRQGQRRRQGQTRRWWWWRGHRRGST